MSPEKRFCCVSVHTKTSWEFVWNIMFFLFLNESIFKLFWLNCGCLVDKGGMSLQRLKWSSCLITLLYQKLELIPLEDQTPRWWVTLASETVTHLFPVSMKWKELSLVKYTISFIVVIMIIAICSTHRVHITSQHTFVIFPIDCYRKKTELLD